MPRSLQPLSAAALRRQIAACQQELAVAGAESTWSAAPSVVHAPDNEGGHGNFLRASFRRIVADPEWSARLRKRYTADARLPRAQDRWRGELECANSSDALLMNLFCYPGVTLRPALCGLLGIAPGERPQFGVRAGLRMHRDEVDRTELDMVIGDLLVEAKLTEGGFGSASRERLLRYAGVEDVFQVEDLPWSPAGVRGYQLIRGVLAAAEGDSRFLLLCDGRRTDLQELWFLILRAVRSSALRSRMALLSWQELAATLPPTLRRFTAAKYGIFARM